MHSPHLSVDIVDGANVEEKGVGLAGLTIASLSRRSLHMRAGPDEELYPGCMGGY